MFIQEFKARLCRRSNMIQLMPKRKEKKERRLAFIFCCFHYLAQQKKKKRFKMLLGGIFPIFYFPFCPCLNLNFHVNSGERKRRLSGYVEWKIRSKILLICHFRSLLGEAQKEFLMLSQPPKQEKEELFKPNLTGTILRWVEKYKKLKYQHGI